MVSRVFGLVVVFVERGGFGLGRGKRRSCTAGGLGLFMRRLSRKRKSERSKKIPILVSGQIKARTTYRGEVN